MSPYTALDAFIMPFNRIARGMQCTIFTWARFLAMPLMSSLYYIISMIIITKQQLVSICISRRIIFSILCFYFFTGFLFWQKTRLERLSFPQKICQRTLRQREIVPNNGDMYRWFLIRSRINLGLVIPNK